MTELALMLAAAAVGFTIAQWLRLPVIPILLVLGFVVSLSGVAPDREVALFVVELGLAVLVFAAGIELNPRRFRHQTLPVLWVATAQFLVIGLAGFATAHLLGHTGVTALYIALAVAASSTLVVIRHLKTRQQMFEPFGRLVTGVLLIQDVLLIIAIVVLSRLEDGLGAVGDGLGGLAVLAAFAVALNAWVVPWVVNRLKLDEESLLLGGLALLFVFLGGCAFLGMPLIAGAFLAGFVLSAFPVNGLMRGLLGSISDFFQAIFFIAVGAVVVITDPSVVWQALALALVVLLLTPFVVAAVAEWQGFSCRAAVESGLLLAQASELSLVVALVGYGLGQLSMEVFSTIALASVITMVLTPFIANDAMTWFLLRWHPSRKSTVRQRAHENHVLVVGFGGGGMWVVKPLLAAGHKVLVIDDDPAVVQQLGIKKIACLRGDGSDPLLLDKAGAKKALLIIAAIPRTDDILKIIGMAEGTPVVARVFESASAEAVRRAGGTPVLTAQAAVEKFMEWFDKAEEGQPTVPAAD